MKQIKVIFKTKFQVSGNCPKDKQELKKSLLEATYEALYKKGMSVIFEPRLPPHAQLSNRDSPLEMDLSIAATKNMASLSSSPSSPSEGYLLGKRGVLALLISPAASCGPT